MQFFVKSAPAFGVGTLRSTVTVTFDVELQPLVEFVVVNEYVVVTVGLAVGLDTDVELNPVAGLHE